MIGDTMQMTTSEAVDMAAQYQSPLNRPNLSVAEYREVCQAVATALHAGGLTVPNWIDPSSRHMEVVPVEKGLPDGVHVVLRADTVAEMLKGEKRVPESEIKGWITVGEEGNKHVIPLTKDSKITYADPEKHEEIVRKIAGRSSHEPSEDEYTKQELEKHHVSEGTRVQGYIDTATQELEKLRAKRGKRAETQEERSIAARIEEAKAHLPGGEKYETALPAREKRIRATHQAMLADRKRAKDIQDRKDFLKRAGELPAPGAPDFKSGMRNLGEYERAGSAFHDRFGSARDREPSASMAGAEIDSKLLPPTAMPEELLEQHAGSPEAMERLRLHAKDRWERAMYSKQDLVDGKKYDPLTGEAKKFIHQKDRAEHAALQRAENYWKEVELRASHAVSAPDMLKQIRQDYAEEPLQGDAKSMSREDLDRAHGNALANAENNFNSRIGRLQDYASATTDPKRRGDLADRAEKLSAARDAEMERLHNEHPAVQEINRRRDERKQQRTESGDAWQQAAHAHDYTNEYGARVPSLGKDSDDIFGEWQRLSESDPFPSQRRVVGQIVDGGGRYAWQNGEIVRLHPAQGKNLASYAPATRAEKTEIDRAIRSGTFEVKALPHEGITGNKPYNRFDPNHANHPGHGYYDEFHRATGNPLEGTSEKTKLDREMGERRSKRQDEAVAKALGEFTAVDANEAESEAQAMLEDAYEGDPAVDFDSPEHFVSAVKAAWGVKDTARARDDAEHATAKDFGKEAGKYHRGMMEAGLVGPDEFGETDVEMSKLTPSELREREGEFEKQQVKRHVEFKTKHLGEEDYPQYHSLIGSESVPEERQIGLFGGGGRPARKVDLAMRGRNHRLGGKEYAVHRRTQGERGGEWEVHPEPGAPLEVNDDGDEVAGEKQHWYPSKEDAVQAFARKHAGNAAVKVTHPNAVGAFEEARPKEELPEIRAAKWQQVVRDWTPEGKEAYKAELQQHKERYERKKQEAADRERGREKDREAEAERNREMQRAFAAENEKLRSAPDMVGADGVPLHTMSADEYAKKAQSEASHVVMNHKEGRRNTLRVDGATPLGTYGYKAPKRYRVPVDKVEEARNQGASVAREQQEVHTHPKRAEARREHATAMRQQKLKGG